MYSMTAYDKQELTPVLISKVTGKRYPATKAGRAQLDADEGRVKLYNDQLEAMVVARGCLVMLRGTLERLMPFIKATGAGKMLAAGIGLVRRCIEQMMCKVSSAQCQTMDANTRGVTVTVSSVKVPGMVNISQPDLTMITDRALEACEMYCTASCQESKSCPLRRALECVPMLSGVKRDAGAEDCPYKGVRLEVDG